MALSKSVQVWQAQVLGEQLGLNLALGAAEWHRPFGESSGNIHGMRCGVYSVAQRF